MDLTRATLLLPKMGCQKTAENRPLENSRQFIDSIENGRKWAFGKWQTTYGKWQTNMSRHGKLQTVIMTLYQRWARG